MRRVFKSISRGLKQAVRREKRRRTNRDEMTTVAETRFRARAARGAGRARRGLALLAKARGERRGNRSG